MERVDVENYLKAYGNEMRDKRKEAGMSQDEVADYVCCSQAIIRHIECGYMLPPRHIEMALDELYSG